MIIKIYYFFAHSIAILLGALIGIGISFITNCTLIELSRNKFISYYFSFFFLIIGLYILIRSIRSYQTSFQNPDYIQVQKKDKLRHQYLIFLGILLIVSALFSYSLHISFLQKVHYAFKIPIFSILGISVTFSLCITVIDIINMAFHLIQAKDSRPPINSSQQLLPIIFTSCVMGLAFGTVFGIMDMEEVSLRYIKEMLVKEENYCIPIGVICGGLAGLFASIIDNNEGGSDSQTSEFKSLSQEDEVEV